MRRRNVLVFAVLGCLAFALTLYLTAPGWMSNDSGIQLLQARSLQFRDDHPIMMALIWHFTDRILPGPVGLLALMVGLYWGGLSAIFAALPGPLLARGIGLFAVGFYPPAASNLPVLWKDNLMQGALLASIACLLVPSARFRAARYAAALSFCLIAIGARHNAPAAVWPFLIPPLLGLPLLRRVPTVWRWLAAAGASVALTLALTVGLGRGLAPLAQKTEFWQIVPVFDLAGMSMVVGEVLVDPEAHVLTAGMGLREIGYKYNPEHSNSLYYCLPFAGKRCVPLFRRTLDAGDLRRLRHNWLSAILAHPAAYLAHRAKLSAALLGISGGPSYTYYVGDVSHHPLADEYPSPQRVRRLLSWIESNIPSLWFRPWLYVALSIVVAAVGAFRVARGAPALPLLFATSGLSYTLSVLVGAGTSDYRYTVWGISCGVLSLATLLLPALAADRGERDRASAGRAGAAAPGRNEEDREVPA